MAARRIGVMGAIADAVLAGEGEAIGIIPHGVFEREVAHTALSELHVVHSMHARKALMAEKSDAFLALPGGLGTFDELFEILTWKQIGIHDKPIGLLDVEGYFSDTLRLIQRAQDEGFLDHAPHRDHVAVDRSRASNAASASAAPVREMTSL